MTPLALAARAAGLLAAPALFQLVLHPLLSGGSPRTWALYWLYTLPGVVLPGTLVAVAAVRWRADWLTWVGLGWALGHALELVGLLLARQLGQPLLFALWIPAAAAWAWSRREDWSERVEPVAQPARTAGALLLLLAVGGPTYFALNVAEISEAPPARSDVWFHVSNAVEFRDHAPMQDPRLAGEPFNYHVFGYAASAAASLATGEPLAPLLVRHSGMSCVLLLALGLFNLGRSFAGGRVAAGAVSALLVLFPLELLRLVHGQLVFGTAYQLYGVYISTSTLAGHVFLAPLLLLVLWHLRGLGWSAAGVTGLLAFAGAGSKAMFAPIVLCASFGVLAWESLEHRRLSRRAAVLAALAAVAVTPPILPLLFAEASYVQGVRWSFAEFAPKMAYFPELLRWGAGDGLARSVWILGFSAPLLAGAGAAAFARRRDARDRSYAVFAWALFAAALIPGLTISMSGFSQLFFLYYGHTALASMAGDGLLRLLRFLRSPRALGTAACLWLAVQIALGFPATLAVTHRKSSPIAARMRWWDHAVTAIGSPLPNPHRLGRRRQLMHQWKLPLTGPLRAGLDWARRSLPRDAVFAVNVLGASPYGALSERRAFFETTMFHMRAHVTGELDSAEPYFAGRRALVEAWIGGAHRGDLADRLRRAGVTHLFEDRANGPAVPPVPGLGPPVFENDDLRIFALSEGTRGAGGSASAR